MHLVDQIKEKARKNVQTVVLPQGEFATFLRSDPEVRRELLQRLFGTEIYDSVLYRPVDPRRAARQSRADPTPASSGRHAGHFGVGEG